MNKRISLLSIVTGLLLALPAFGNETVTTNAPPAKKSMKDLMTDPDDGKFDVSEWLSTAQGFLPVVTLITEPAVGYGAGVMLMFFHDSIKNRAKLVKERNPGGTTKRLPPPSISGVFGMGTENGTWGAGWRFKPAVPAEFWNMSPAITSSRRTSASTQKGSGPTTIPGWEVITNLTCSPLKIAHGIR